MLNEIKKTIIQEQKLKNHALFYLNLIRFASHIPNLFHISLLLKKQFVLIYKMLQVVQILYNKSSLNNLYMKKCSYLVNQGCFKHDQHKQCK